MPNKNRSQDNIGQNRAAGSQDFRPLAPLGVTMKRPCNLSTTAIWEEFSDRLRRFILKSVQQEQDADDILQDVFYKIHDSVHNLKDGDKLESWIYQITRNAVVDHYRRRAKSLTDVSEIPDVAGEDVAAAGMDDSNEDVSACIRPMIADLPEKYRQAILLTEYEEMTQKELAENLGLSLSGAKSRVQRARGRLKDMLLACCHFEFDRLGNITDYQPREGSCRQCSGD